MVLRHIKGSPEGLAPIDPQKHPLLAAYAADGADTVFQSLLRYARSEVKGSDDTLRDIQYRARAVLAKLAGTKTPTDEALDVLRGKLSAFLKEDTDNFLEGILRDEEALRAQLHPPAPNQTFVIEGSALAEMLKHVTGEAEENARVRAEAERRESDPTLQQKIENLLGEQAAQGIIEIITTTTEAVVKICKEPKETITIKTPEEIIIIQKNRLLRTAQTKETKVPEEVVKVHEMQKIATNNKEIKFPTEMAFGSPRYVVLSDSPKVGGAIFLSKLTKNVPEGYKQYRLPAHESLLQAMGNEEGSKPKPENFLLTEKSTHGELSSKKSPNGVPEYVVLEILSGLEK